MRLSIVYAVRDPDYGDNLLRRMQVSLNTLAALAEQYELDCEIVVVEWNPPPDQKLIADLITWPRNRKTALRFIEVPSEQHARLEHSCRNPFLEYIAKNVGIRRAKGDWILACSPDVIFNRRLVEFLARGSLDEGCFYRIDRRDVKASLSPEWSPRRILAACGRSVRVINSQYGSIAIPAPHYSIISELLTELFYRREYLRLKRSRTSFALPELSALRERVDLPVDSRSLTDDLLASHTNASGDFFLMSRGSWYRLQGYTELTTHAHIDSIMCWTALLGGLQQVVLGDGMRLYHQEHDRHSHATFPQTDLPAWRERVIAAVLNGSGLVSNDVDWGIRDREFEEIVLP